MGYSPCQNRMIPGLFHTAELLESVLRSAGNRARTSSNRPGFTSSVASLNRSRESGMMRVLRLTRMKVVIRRRLDEESKTWLEGGTHDVLPI